MSQPPPLDEAIQALRRDPTHQVRVKVDTNVVARLLVLDNAPLEQEKR